MSGTDWIDRHFTSADGLRLYYRDYPAAEPGRLPVLCLPGLTRNCRDFESSALRIQRTRRVLSPDLRGRGRSQYDPNFMNYHPGTYVADLARLLADAGVAEVILFGTSLGGILSMLIA
ncbi:MAG TPA: alpha/beta hydrolase, partial [Steroidobacteraceae bacterium]